jgi:hypothetical protein
LFADHVEVLVDAARQGNFRAAYALAWEPTPKLSMQAPLSIAS